jgi:hypothetical protein
MEHIGSNRAFDGHVSKIVIDRSVFSREIERHVRKIFTDQLSVR